MKRSELIESMAEELASHQAIAMTSGNYWEYLAKLAIKLAEDAGMKPPENGMNYEGYGSGDDYMCISTPNYEWEKE